MVPKNWLESTETVLAALAAAVAACGLLLCGVAYFAVFLFLQNADSAVSPQIDSAEIAVANLQTIVAAAAQGAGNASGAVASLSGALADYSAASTNFSNSASDIAKVPPFSLDGRFAAAASSMKQASVHFADAAAAANATADSAFAASAGVEKAATDLEAAKSSIRQARQSFKDALGALHLAALAGFLSLSALFTSVMLLSGSVLLTHYPKFFDRGEKE